MQRMRPIERSDPSDETNEARNAVLTNTAAFIAIVAVIKLCKSFSSFSHIHHTRFLFEAQVQLFCFFIIQSILKTQTLLTYKLLWDYC